MNKFTEYTILKAVQVFALLALPTAMLEDYMTGSWWCVVNAWVLTLFLRDFYTSQLENKYISDTL